MIDFISKAKLVLEVEATAVRMPEVDIARRRPLPRLRCQV